MRYLPLTADDRSAMLARIGAGSIDDLYVDVPEAARLTAPLDLPDHRSEFEVEREIAAFAGRNLSPGTAPSFLGEAVQLRRHPHLQEASHATGKEDRSRLQEMGQGRFRREV